MHIIVNFCDVTRPYIMSRRSASHTNSLADFVRDEGGVMSTLTYVGSSGTKRSYISRKVRLNINEDIIRGALYFALNLYQWCGYLFIDNLSFSSIMARE